MDNIFINSVNNETSDPYRLLLNLSNKINLKRSDKYVALSNLIIYFHLSINSLYMEKIKKSYRNTKFKISGKTWNEKSELPDGSCSESDVQNYLEYVIKKHNTFTNNPPITIYVNKIKNRIMFIIKKGYYLELLTPETMKLLRSKNIKMIKMCLI